MQSTEVVPCLVCKQAMNYVSELQVWLSKLCLVSSAQILTCTSRVAMMLLALMSPGIPRYWIPFLEKIVAPASNQGTWLVPFSSSGTTHPATHQDNLNDCLPPSANNCKQLDKSAHAECVNPMTQAPACDHLPTCDHVLHQARDVYLELQAWPIWHG